MAELEKKASKKETVRCTCQTKEVNHFVRVIVEEIPCKKHPRPERREPTRRDLEFDRQYHPVRNAILEDIARRHREAEALVAKVRAAAAAEGREPTFADLKRASGVMDWLPADGKPTKRQAAKFGALPEHVKAGAKRDVAGEFELMRPPPPMDPYGFDLLAERAEIFRRAGRLPDTKESAPEYHRLIWLYDWCTHHSEAGRAEFNSAERESFERMRQATAPVEELGPEDDV